MAKFVLQSGLTYLPNLQRISLDKFLLNSKKIAIFEVYFFFIKLNLNMIVLVVSAIFAALGTISIAVDWLDRSFGGLVIGLLFGGMCVGVKNTYLSWTTMTNQQQDVILLIGGSIAGIGLGLMAVQLRACYLYRLQNKKNT